jgi:hypothetical protein
MTLKKILDGAYHPVDANAARVATKRGDHWEPAAFTLNQHWRDHPWPTTATVPRGAGNKRIAKIPPGTRFGRFTYLGIGLERSNDGHATAIVRCDCGLYGRIESKRLTRENIHEERRMRWCLCPLCIRLEQLRQGHVVTPQERKIIHEARAKLEAALGVKRTAGDLAWAAGMRKSGDLKP